MSNQYTYDDEFLAARRLVCDGPADRFIQYVFEDTTRKQSLFERLKKLNTNPQLSELTITYPNYNLFTTADELPDWADQKKMAKGAAFFASHAEAIMNLLGLLSLPYCYAAADGAMVLYVSQRLRTDAGKRLQDTGEFVWEVMAPGAFAPQGKGFASILKVRLMHAAARYYVQKDGNWNPGWGMPVNQEDMAGTNIAFSLIVIRGLRELGYAIAADEQEAFLHLWNVIGGLLGIKQELLPGDIKDTRNLEAAIRKRHFRTSEQGQELMQSLIGVFAEFGSAMPDFKLTEALSLMRYLLGDEVAAILGISGQGLTRDKIKLMQAISLWQDIKPGLSPTLAYREAYHKFKR